MNIHLPPFFCPLNGTCVTGVHGKWQKINGIGGSAGEREQGHDLGTFGIINRRSQAKCRTNRNIYNCLAGESCKCEWAWFRLLKSKLWAHQHLLTNCAGHRGPFSPEERLGSMWQQSCSICSSSGEGSSRTLPFTPTWLPQLHTTVPSSRGPGCSCPHTGSQSDVMAPLRLSSRTLFSPGLTPLPLVLPPPCPQWEEEPFPVSQERREGSCSREHEV